MTVEEIFDDLCQKYVMNLFGECCRFQINIYKWIKIGIRWALFIYEQIYAVAKGGYKRYIVMWFFYYNSLFNIYKMVKEKRLNIRITQNAFDLDKNYI